jgi:hypothetical protein
MMKKRKFGSGGMPSMKESMESGNRVSRQVGAETKKLMPATRSTRPSVGDAIASGNRMSKKNAEDLKAVKKYAKGGKVKPVDVDMKGLEEASRSKTSFDTSGLESKGTEARKANAAQAKEAKKQSFRDAFAAARKKALAGGPDTFKWMGKSYGTQLAGEKPKAKPAAKSEAKSGADKSRSNNPYDSKTPMKNIARNIDTSNSPMTDTQIRKFMSDNDKAADRSLDDTQIRKFVKDLNADADRSLAATKAMKDKKEAEEKRLASNIGRATTASLSDAASRAIPRTPGMAKGGSVSKRGDGCAVRGKTKGKMV